MYVVGDVFMEEDMFFLDVDKEDNEGEEEGEEVGVGDS